jgi:hypothetical protein
MSRLHPISGCDNPVRKADVVFIHGLGGDAFTTWAHAKEPAASWPHWLGKEFPQIRVWSLGYAASPTRWARLLRLIGRGSRDSGYGMALPDRALQVLDLMLQRGLGEFPLLFICHSLGGLLAKQILRKSSEAADPRMQQVARNTRAVLFLATPHAGAMLASFADAFRTVFGPTVSIENLREHDAHLRDLFDWYRNYSLRSQTQTATYFELRCVRGVLPIVNPTSAHPGVGMDPVGLDEDHLSIAKPLDSEAQVCGAARNLLRNYVLAAPPRVQTAAAAAQAGASEGQELVIKLDTAALSKGEPFRVPRELPPPAYRFFGREAERQQLSERLRLGRNRGCWTGGNGQDGAGCERARRCSGRERRRPCREPISGWDRVHRSVYVPRSTGTGLEHFGQSHMWSGIHGTRVWPRSGHGSVPRPADAGRD